MEEKILIIDFYGQYNQLIARRVRECNVYSEIVPYTASFEKIIEKKPKGIIFTGGPASVYENGAPTIDKKIFEVPYTPKNTVKPQVLYSQRNMSCIE